MLYLGHFSFAEYNDENPVLGQERFGYFTLVCEAESIDHALVKFRDILINQSEQQDDIFDRIKRVFLDSCMECSSIPPNGFLAHFSELFGEMRGSISTTIRGATDEEVSVYFMGEDNSDHDEEPFLEFD